MDKGKRVRQIAEVAATPARDLALRLDELVKTQLTRLMRPHEAERLRRAVLNLLQTQRTVAECDPRSILLCVLQAAYLNLDPSPALGHVYFVPFENREAGVKEAQLLIGYKGWMELAYRSKKVKLVQAHVVRPSDEFKIELGVEPKIYHVPKPPGDDDAQDDIVAAYAVAVLDDGQRCFDVMWKKEIEAIKARSRAAKSTISPWHTDYEAMAKAKAVRRLVKWLPKTVEVSEAVTVDEYADAGISITQLETEESLLGKLADARRDRIEESKDGVLPQKHERVEERVVEAQDAAKEGQGLFEPR